ncbi:MAG: sulfite reductase, dissimilatory-type subunit alpha, partial [Syntrophorhabdus sp.]
TWRVSIRIDQAVVQNYLIDGFNVEKHVVNRCPTEALELDPQTGVLRVKEEDCVRCMHCINLMTKAIRPGVEKGTTILIGGKAPIIKGAYLSWVLVPFMKLEPPYDELKDLLRKIWDWWDENGRTRERVAELIERMGFKTFLREIGLKPLPQMVKYPRSNPYVFFDK